MTNLKTKLATGIASASILAGVLAPAAFAGTTVTVQGNGALSKNGVMVVNSSKTKVSQNSNATVSTTVMTSQNTGGNSSSFNTGGGSSISTGSTNSTTSVGVMGGSNMATMPSMGNSDTHTVTVQGNGAFSWNGVMLSNLSKKVVSQNNNLLVVTNVGTAQNTGSNHSGFNTGGNSTTGTGGANSMTTVVVEGGSNTLN